MLSARVDGLDRQQLRELADSLRNKWKTGIVVLATAADSNVAIISAVTKDLTCESPCRQARRARSPRPSAAKAADGPTWRKPADRSRTLCRRRSKTSTQPSRACCEREFDAVVIGAGPTGLACGIELKKRGVNAVLIEKGCVVNSLYHYPTNMVFFTTPELLEIGDIPMTSLNDKPNRTEALKYYRRVADHYKLDVHQYETVLSVTGRRRRIRRDRPRTGWMNCSSATGRRRSWSPRATTMSRERLDCPGEDLPKVIHYYKEPHPLLRSRRGGHRRQELGRDRGAGIMVDRRARHADPSRRRASHNNVKYWIKPNIENRIKNGEIPGYFHSEVTEIRPDCDRSAHARKAKSSSRTTSFWR